jgi:molybdopterin-guanine dinucleotide biosynthesis protein A
MKLADFPDRWRECTPDCAPAPRPGCLLCPAIRRFCRSIWYRSLAAGVEAETTKLAVASCNGRLQQVFVLLHCELLPALETYLNTGGRKIES